MTTTTVTVTNNITTLLSPKHTNDSNCETISSIRTQNSPFELTRHDVGLIEMLNSFL